MTRDAEGWVEAADLRNLLSRRADETPDRVAALDDHGHAVSFAQLRDRAEAVAAGLHELGVRVGTRVAWQLPTGIDTMALMLALARLGAVQVPVLPIYRRRELGFIVDQARPEVLIVRATWRGFDHAALAADVLAALPPSSVRTRLVVADPDLPTGHPQDLPAMPVADGDPIRWVFYTSGTTGDPKGVQHTDGSVLAGARAMCVGPAVRSDDRVPIVFPMSHVGGVVWLGAGPISGCMALVVEQFDPDATIAFLDREGMTLGAGGTVFVSHYLEYQRRTPGSPVLQTVRAFLGGAAPKPPDLHDALKREIGGAGVLSSYGLTECPILSCSRLGDSDDVLRSTEGVLSPGVEARVVDRDGAEVAPGDEGELLVRGPQLFAGYLDPSLDAGVFEGGWFRTGDLVTVDADGYVRVTGRLKEIIIRKGESISAKEIEDLLSTHSSVADVAVIGLPDEATGERVCAVVVPAPGAAPTLDDVCAHLRAAGLMAQKLPEQLELVDGLPRNATGKVVKQTLRTRFSPIC